ncbi:MAG: sigma-70 family RNA polymerase sigma factor [Phycisphaerae bacterium]
MSRNLELLERHRGELRALITKLTNADVDDLMQDIQLHLWLKVDQIPACDTHAQHWLARVTKNYVWAKHRGMKIDFATGDAIFEGDEKTAPGVTPSSDAARASQVERIKDAIKELPPNEKEVIESYFFGHMSVNDIAKKLGFRSESVSRIKERAIKNIMKLVGSA